MRDGGPLMDIERLAIESARATNGLCQRSVDPFLPPPPTAPRPTGDAARCQSLHATGAAAAPFAHSIARVLADRAGCAPESPWESPRPGRRKARRPKGEAPGMSDAPRRPRGRPPISKCGPGSQPTGAARNPAGPDSAKAALAMEGILPDFLSQKSFRPGRPIGRPVGSRHGARNATAAARPAATGEGGPAQAGRHVGWRLKRRLM